MTVTGWRNATQLRTKSAVDFWSRWELSFWFDQAFIILVIIGFWWRQITGSLNGQGPLVGWMLSAESAILILTWLTLEVYRTSTGRQRKEMGMLLVQFCLIIAGNTVVAAMQLWQLVNGARLKPWDLTIFQIDLVGMYILLIFVALGMLRPKSAWAKCWYTVVLKAAPQFVQALWIFTRKGTIDLLGAGFLVVQAAWRWKTPLKAFMRAKGNAPDNVKALTVSTSIDFLSTLFVGAAAVLYVL